MESSDASMQTSAPRSTRLQSSSPASQVIAPTGNTPPSPSNTGSGASLLPARGGTATLTPVPASAAVESSDVEETSSPVSDEVTVDHEVEFTPTQQAPASVLFPRQSPLSHTPTSGAVVSTAPVEPNLPSQAPPPSPASLPPTPSTLPSLHTQSLSPISDPQVAPAPIQKIAPSPSTSHFDIPASASPTNIPQGPKFQALHPSSKSPPPDGVVKAPQNVLLSRARAHASASAPVSASSPPIQSNPKPPARRQSSGLDFLQLDLQVAREKQRAVAEAVISGPVTHVSSPTSISGRGTPAVTTAAAITAAPSTPVQPVSSPIVAQGTTALASPIRTSPVNPRTAIPSESDDLQPQKAQTTASRPVHRDLRQRSKSSGSGTPGTPKLQITDRAPAPPPEPGSSAAPIVVDEDDEVPVSMPAEEKMDVDVPVQALPHVEAKPFTVLDSRDSRGDEENVKGHPKPQPHQEESAASEHLPEQDVSAPQSTSCVLVPKANLPAAIIPDAAGSAQKPSGPEGKEPHGEKGGKDLSNEDVEMTTTLVLAEKKTTTTTLARVDGERETMEVSVECGKVAVVSGTTIEQPSGNESALNKVSPQPAVGVMAVPETGNTETTPLAPPATAPIAATTEASSMPAPSPDEFIRTLLGMMSSESGPGLDSQVPVLRSAPDDKILTLTSEASLKRSHRRGCRRSLSDGCSGASFREASEVSYS